MSRYTTLGALIACLVSHGQNPLVVYDDDNDYDATLENVIVF